MKEQAMRCLYCGRQLKLLKRLTGGDFCSEEHQRLFEGHFSERALNRLLKEKPVEVPRSDPSGSSTAQTASPQPTAALTPDRDAQPARDLANPEKPSATAVEQAPNPTPKPSGETRIEKNAEDRPLVPESAAAEERPAAGHAPAPGVRGNRTSTQTMVPFIDYKDQDPAAAETSTEPPADFPAPDDVGAPDQVSDADLIEEEVLVHDDEPVRLAEPIVDLPLASAVRWPVHPEAQQTNGAAVGAATATAMDLACQSGMDPQRFQLANADLPRLAEELAAANAEEPLISEEIPAADSTDEADLSNKDVAAELAVEQADLASEPEENLASKPSENHEIEEPDQAANTDTDDDGEWLNREWNESTLLPVPLPHDFIQDWRPESARCAKFPSRDPEFSISQPAFEVPQPKDIGKLPDLVTEAASWQGYVNPGKTIEVHWQDTPLGKLSTECVAGAAARLAFHAIGLDGRGKGPLPVRPIGPIGLPKKLTPPLEGLKETALEPATQNPRNTVPPRLATRQEEAENDIDQVEAKLQSLTALARFTQRPVTSPPESVRPAEPAQDQDTGQASDIVPPPAVNAPLPVTLLGSAAPRRRATVVFPIGIPAQLGPVISIPAKVPIREVIYLLPGDPEDDALETVDEAYWLEDPDLEEFQGEFQADDMNSDWHDAESEDPQDPFFGEFSEENDAELPSTLTEEPPEEIDEQEMHPEDYPQEGPENV